MTRTHQYQTTVTWTGNRGTGTSSYKAYGRDHEIAAPGLAPIAGSADRVFHGDRDRWNPELMLTAALSQCHLLSYLHVCAEAGVVVTGYTDEARGTMTETAGGGGHFTEVVLRPRVTVRDASMTEAALRLHAEASARCFIAASVNFPVRHEPEVTVAPGEPPVSPVPPVRREILVDANPVTAFEAFTDDIGRWWPLAELSVYGAGGTVTLANQEIVERSADGHSALWGTITRWEPPVGVAFSWHPGDRADRASHVQVTFAPAPGVVAPGVVAPDGPASDGPAQQTLVTLVHTGWDSFDDPGAARDEYDEGWPLVLGRYSGHLGTLLPPPGPAQG